MISSYSRVAEVLPCTWCRLRSLAAREDERYVAPHRCFGLLGADVMVDAEGRPWLLEVNNCPNISGATGHVARDARAAAWRGDVFDNRASKNYEVRAQMQRRLRCVLTPHSAAQVKAAVLSDAFTLLGFKGPASGGCGREVCCCRVEGWACCDERSLDLRRGGFERLSCGP